MHVRRGVALAPAFMPTVDGFYPGGGRRWWAHFEFTRIKTTPTILRKKLEERQILDVNLSKRSLGYGQSRTSPMLDYYMLFV
jgi:hypothetical protein